MYTGPPYPYPGSPAPPSPPKRKPVWPWIVSSIAVLAFVVLATVAIALVVTADEGDDDSGPVAAPEQWDSSVGDLVDFVEDDRDGRFDHPVPVEFMTADEYRDEVVVDDDDLSDDDRDYFEHQGELLRALGLAEGDLDLAEAGNELADEGTLAFYEPERERIVVRGSADDVDDDVTLRGTLVHELTHALQHQRFPEVFDDSDPTSGEAFGTTALVEGDALRIEYDYVDSLSDAEQDEYDDAFADQAGPGGDALADVPASLVAFFDAPYVLGDPFLTILDAMGADEVDDAFEDPPTSDEQLLDPFRYLDEDEPRLLDPPEVDGDVVDEGDFGAVGWLVVLAERIDPLRALDAVEGWRGDGYTLWTDDEVTCVDMAVEGDTASDTDELESALGDWAAGLPAVAPDVSRDGDTIAVHACDPGSDADLGLTGQGARALAYPATRGYFAADEVDYGTDLEGARCLADDLVRRYTLDELEAPEWPADAGDRFEAAAQTCGVD
jgi:hypothetical protein